MPTYDYLCRECGNEGEYSNIPSGSHPLCNKCGSGDMQGLPSKINIGGLEFKSVRSEDLTGPGIAIRTRPFEAQCTCGHKISGIEVEVSLVNGGPSMN